jgi:hypothetical protein
VTIFGLGTEGMVLFLAGWVLVMAGVAGSIQKRLRRTRATRARANAGLKPGETGLEGAVNGALEAARRQEEYRKWLAANPVIGSEKWETANAVEEQSQAALKSQDEQARWVAAHASALEAVFAPLDERLPLINRMKEATNAIDRTADRIEERGDTVVIERRCSVRLGLGVKTVFDLVNHLSSELELRGLEVFLVGDEGKDGLNGANWNEARESGVVEIRYHRLKQTREYPLRTVMLGWSQRDHGGRPVLSLEGSLQIGDLIEVGVMTTTYRGGAPWRSCQAEMRVTLYAVKAPPKPKAEAKK